jgi:hypothetical protein
VSSTGAAGSRTTVPKILNAVIGTKFKVITGYDTAGASLAVERGEVDGLCGVSYATLMASNPSWLTDKRVNVLAQLALRKDPHVPDVPMVLDMVRSGSDRRLLDLILVVQEVGRPVIAPPDLPPDPPSGLGGGVRRDDEGSRVSCRWRAAQARARHDGTKGNRRIAQEGLCHAQGCR